ncbi:hypothetical protein O0L34_g8224 [Tuta absoluta]|nr:hypothetical protein O0L34_g8224 [Tuta absoluta]
MASDGQLFTRSAQPAATSQLEGTYVHAERLSLAPRVAADSRGESPGGAWAGAAPAQQPLHANCSPAARSQQRPLNSRVHMYTLSACPSRLVSRLIREVKAPVARGRAPRRRSSRSTPTVHPQRAASSDLSTRGFICTR